MSRSLTPKCNILFAVFTCLFLTTAAAYSYSASEDYNEESPSQTNYLRVDKSKGNYYYGARHKDKQESERGLSRNKLDELDKWFAGESKQATGNEGLEQFSGNWLPKSSYQTQKKYKSKSQKISSNIRKDSHNRVQMGVSNSLCDDAKTNLTNDWDGSPVNYTCYHPERYYPEDPTKSSLLECVDLPPSYTPGHVCMNETISYTDSIPTHGDHRPLWPMFGEYVFVPRERWLHNIEHGAVVMLYHPCANPSEVNRLKSILTGCYGKHIITPSTFLRSDRPLALVAWGCRLLMATSDDELAVKFIEEKALKGPEGTYTKEGQYDWGLIQSGNATGTGSRIGYTRVDCDSSSFM